MPYGYKYPAGKEIWEGKIKKGDLSDVPDGKLYREGLEMDSNRKIKQGDLGKEEGTKKRVNMVDKSIFTKAEQRDY
jgi:hypothetical protein|tara:strand:+ start:115 stop:342 length:228 start_codon:yes stop_codon:yes gene_type:complete